MHSAGYCLDRDMICKGVELYAGEVSNRDICSVVHSAVVVLCWMSGDKAVVAAFRSF